MKLNIHLWLFQPPAPKPSKEQPVVDYNKLKVFVSLISNDSCLALKAFSEDFHWFGRVLGLSELAYCDTLHVIHDA